MGWMFNDKHALHQELGAVFIIVTPGGNEVMVADPQVTHTILSHRKAFIKPAAMYGMDSIVKFFQLHVDRSAEQLNVFGQNLNTVSWLPCIIRINHLNIGALGRRQRLGAPKTTYSSQFQRKNQLLGLA